MFFAKEDLQYWIMDSSLDMEAVAERRVTGWEINVLKNCQVDILEKKGWKERG